MFGKEREENPNYILSKESAENELKKLFSYYEIDVDEIEDKRLKDAIKSSYGRLIKAARLGRLEIKIDNGIKVIQTLRSTGAKIEYREIDGMSKRAMDECEPEAFNTRGQALAGSLSGLGSDAIANLKGVDLALMEVLGLIFLSV